MTARGAATGSVYALTLVAVLTIALSTLTRFDFWWYLKAGEIIVDTRSVPTTDPFSYTAQGRPWINHMWATQVLLALVWRTWGRTAIVLGKGALVAATFAVVLATVRRRGIHPLLGSALCLIGAWTGAGFWEVRPQVLTYLLVAVYLWILREGWATRRSTWWAIPALMIPWVNLHAGFIIGFGLIALVGVGTALPRLVESAPRREGWTILGHSVVLGGLAVLASLVNPYGPRAILFPLEVVGTSAFMSSTLEWLSPNFHNPLFWGFEAMLLLIFPAVAWGRASLSMTDVLLLFTFAHLGLLSIRHVPIFAIVAIPPLAVALQGGLEECRRRAVGAPPLVARARAALPSLWPLASSPVTWLVGAAGLLLLGVALYWGAFLGAPGNPLRLDLNEHRYPREAITFIDENRLPAPLFNVYAWAGYELWRLYPRYRVFIDGRTHVYGPEILDDFLAVVNVSERWQTVLDHWKIQTILANRPSLLVEALSITQGWRPVFDGEGAVIFVRESPQNRELLGRLAAATTPADSSLAPDLWRHGLARQFGATAR
ncbi:MAG: hypothetical protein DMD79_02195 [Candidatus Rokuibacteriota bacterium]|nr:MAG: hypothetical protein DMD79_02195 [Candidatus Rokubacteria bacterium]